MIHTTPDHPDTDTPGQPQPSRAKNRGARWLRGAFGLCAGLMIVIATQNDAENKPAHLVATPPDTTGLHADTTGAVNTTQVERLRTEFSRTQLGRDMLAYADSVGIRIEFDMMVDFTSSAAVYTLNEDVIRFGSGLSLENQTIILAHELRHAWQDNTLGLGKMSLKVVDPAQQWAMDRLCEADAYAYAVWFMANRMQELGEDSATVAGRSVFKSDLELASKIRRAIDNGTFTAAFYRDEVLLPCYLQLEGHDGYTKAHGARMTKRLKYLNGLTELAGLEAHMHKHDSAYARAISVEKILQHAPSDDVFEKFLRGFGGTSLDPQQKTSLQSPDVSRHDLMEYYPKMSGDLSGKLRHAWDSSVAYRDSVMPQMRQRIAAIKSLPDSVTQVQKP